MRSLLRRLLGIRYGPDIDAVGHVLQAVPVFAYTPEELDFNLPLGQKAIAGLPRDAHHETTKMAVAIAIREVRSAAASWSSEASLSEIQEIIENEAGLEDRRDRLVAALDDVAREYRKRWPRWACYVHPYRDRLPLGSLGASG